MTWPQPSDDRSGRAFLVERYISPAAAVQLAARTARVAGLCADSHDTDTRVRYLCSAYLPTEDTCFCLFWAPSIEAVRAVNDQADFALDRIIDAVLLRRFEHEADDFRPWSPTRSVDRTPDA